MATGAFEDIYTDRDSVLSFLLFQQDKGANPNVYRKMALTGFLVKNTQLYSMAVSSFFPTGNQCHQ